MKTGRWWNTCYWVIVVVLTIWANTVFITAAYAEESIETECYIKVDDDYVLVGNVDVSDESKMAATCNSVYIDCKGQCVGCYLDEDDDEYCYDKTGRKFQK